jgi:glucose-1-phosphate adenylyltransferase
VCSSDLIINAYPPHILSDRSVEILAAEQKPNSQQWFMGTADAIRKNKEYLVEDIGDYFLILSGDQLYQMNFQPMVAQAMATGADLVIAALPVDKSNAQRMGILKVDNAGKITNFVEKTSEESVLSQFVCPKPLLEQLGHSQTDTPYYLGSMGIYLFKREALFRLLEEDSREDFGKHLIPTKVAQGGAVAYLFDGYWEDIGTVEAFYNANMALTRPEPFLNFYDENHPLYTSAHKLPAPKIFDTRLVHSIIGEGSIIEAKEVKNSLLGPRSVVKHGTVITDSYLMGNEYYHAPSAHSELPPCMQIGRNCVIQRAIIDSEVCIGDNVHLVNERKLRNYDGGPVVIRDGVIVVTRGAHIPDNFVL